MQQHMKQGMRDAGIALLTVSLIVLQPAYANGGHVHVGGIFFLLLGGVIFIGGLAVICYLLFRAEPEATHEERDDT
jgi:hypothetical protein